MNKLTSYPTWPPDPSKRINAGVRTVIFADPVDALHIYDPRSWRRGVTQHGRDGTAREREPGNQDTNTRQIDANDNGVSSSNETRNVDADGVTPRTGRRLTRRKRREDSPHRARSSSRGKSVYRTILERFDHRGRAHRRVRRIESSRSEQEQGDGEPRVVLQILVTHTIEIMPYNQDDTHVRDGRSAWLPDEPPLQETPSTVPKRQRPTSMYVTRGYWA